MKNAYTFDASFLKDYQRTKAYIRICIEADRIINADHIYPQLRHMISSTFSDLSGLRIHRFTGHYTDANQDPDTISLVVSDGYTAIDEITRPIQ